MAVWANGLIIAAVLAAAGCCFLFGWIFYAAKEGPYWEVTGPAWAVGAVFLLVGVVALVRALMQRGARN